MALKQQGDDKQRLSKDTIPDAFGNPVGGQTSPKRVDQSDLFSSSPQSQYKLVDVDSIAKAYGKDSTAEDGTKSKEDLAKMEVFMKSLKKREMMRKSSRSPNPHPS